MFDQYIIKLQPKAVQFLPETINAVRQKSLLAFFFMAYYKPLDTLITIIVKKYKSLTILFQENIQSKLTSFLCPSSSFLAPGKELFGS